MFVTVDSRLRLEEALLSRWGQKHTDEVLRRLERWCGWRWPLESEVVDTIGHVRKAVRAARVREAKAELPAMLMLPPLTPESEVSLVRARVNFGVLPRTALVLPEERVLSPWHCLGIVGRGLPMCRAISEAIGGQHLVPLAALERELQDQEDEQHVRLLKLEQDAARRDRRPHSDSRSGPSVHAFYF